jgi:Predicted nucleotide-binding protein containing TIR-like domain/Histidine-specific methyltransferase, SAM-dependent
MSKKKIFIGSSTEKKSIAEKIAQLLSNNHYEVLRWWTQFSAGSVTLDRLIDIAKEVDGAIFIFSKDDKKWYRGKEHDSPRDNVVLEYGLFVGLLDRNRAIVLAEENLDLPSDVDSINHLSIKEDVDTLAEETVSHFNRVLSKNNLPKSKSYSTPIHCDPELSRHVLSEHLPDGWHQRDLYIGSGGARSWLAVVNDPEYSARNQANLVSSKLTKAVKSLSLNPSPIKTFISLGPGNAKFDLEIALELRKQETSLAYIPIDINFALLQNATKLLRDRVYVPVGIHADFEERPIFIKNIIKQYCRSPSPILVAMIGNTLANLDDCERSLLNEIHSMMTDKDFLLIDMSILGSKWTKDSDPHRNGNLSDTMKHFIATAVTRRIRVPLEDVTSNFEEYVTLEYTNKSDIDGTQTIEYVNKRTSRSILSVRRYNWDIARQFLMNDIGFDIVFEDTTEFSDVYGCGIIILQKKPNTGIS